MEPEALPSSQEAVEALIPLAPDFDREAFLSEGRHDSAAAIGQALDVLLYGHIASPLWSLYNLAGYEGRKRPWSACAFTPTWQGS